MIGKDAEWGDFPNVVPALNAEVTSQPPTRAPHGPRLPCVTRTVSPGWLSSALLCV